jgi:hypothetical protein
MKKISYLLASAMSALAALTASAATARTNDAEFRPGHNAVRESPNSADAVRVSQRAKDQIGIKAKPKLDAKGVAKSKLKPGIKGSDDPPFNEGFKDVRDGDFTEKFTDKQGRGANPADKRQKTLQKNEVQKTFRKNQAPQQKQSR